MNIKDYRRRAREKLQNGSINDLEGGYPLFHHIVMVLRGAQDAEPYLALLREIIQHNNFDTLRTDKHDSTALDCAIYEGRADVVNLLLDFSHVHAEVLINSLFFAIEEGKAEIIAVLKKYLYQQEHINLFRQTIHSRLQKYKEDCDGKSLDLLIEHELITVEQVSTLLPQPASNITELPTVLSPVEDAYEEGFWIRNINPEEEKLYLQHPETAQYQDKPATFLLKGIPILPINIHLVSVGLIIKLHASTVISVWNSRFIGGERMTNEILAIADVIEEGKATEEATGVYLNKNSQEIAQLLQNHYVQQLELTKNERADSYGFITQQDIKAYHSGFGFNEGLIQYNVQNIIALCVKPDKPDSIRHALEFLRSTAINVPLYHYNSLNGSIKHISQDQIDQLIANTPANNNTWESGIVETRKRKHNAIALVLTPN